jgi:hypothetical protein
MSTPPSNVPASAVDRIDLSAFAPLRPAEQTVVRAFADDDIARVGLRRPLVPSASISVRGMLVSHLARHAGASRRVQIVGAWIEGAVDLRDAAVPEGLWFFRCVFDASPRFDGARIGGSLSFPGCLLPGLRAEDCTVAGDVALNAGCTVRLDVRLARTIVGGNLNLGRLHLSSGERSDMQVPRRLVADGARVAGDALLTDGFESDGDVRLVGVQVVGDLRASAARLSGHVNGAGQRSEALNLDLARVAGNVSLDRGFSAAGGVRLKRARIDGDLDCTQAKFDAFGDMGWRGAVAFALDRARVGGTLVLARLKQPLSRATLADAHVGALHDDATTWGDALVLDGFAYRQLAANAPQSSGFRIQWLERQDPTHIGRDFRAQPWQQLIRAFQRMGLTGAARDVAVANEEQLRRANRCTPVAPHALAASTRPPRVRAPGRIRPPAVACGVGDGGALARLCRFLPAGRATRCGRTDAGSGRRARGCAAPRLSGVQSAGVLARARAAVRRPAAAAPVGCGRRSCRALGDGCAAGRRLRGHARLGAVPTRRGLRDHTAEPRRPFLTPS